MSTFSTKFTSILRRFVPRRIVSYDLVKQKMTLEMPERFKGTFVEKWVHFWKNLTHDYKDVLKDTIKDVRERPVRATAIAWVLSSSWYCMKTNPDAHSFRDEVLSMSTTMATLPASIRNEEASNHLVFLESCNNAGTLRRLNLGIASVMWVSDFDESLGLYASQCKYLKPKYLTFNQRIVDIGFLGRWWVIRNIMDDHDINPKEWS